MRLGLATVFLLQATASLVAGFAVPKNQAGLQFTLRSSTGSPQDGVLRGTTLVQVASAASGETPKEDTKKMAIISTPEEPVIIKKTLKELRKEGGITTFNTPIGALNVFAIYYGLMSIFLGIPWYFALKFCQFLYWITGGRFDKKRRVPVFLSHLWGSTLLRFSRSFPEVENAHILKEFYKQKRPAMFVANHCSWMDIPFLGTTVGWRNYKLVSKKELGIIPILGTAIKVGGNIMVDRLDRKSQIRTLKQGIKYLKGDDGMHLCTFPEGTRSRTGRVMTFKNGAFKMAFKAGAPVIPMSIVNSNKVMPHGWMFAMKPSHGTAKVIIHEPIESIGKTEEELVEAVRASLISGLPDYQQPE